MVNPKFQSKWYDLGSKVLHERLEVEFIALRTVAYSLKSLEDKGILVVEAECASSDENVSNICTLGACISVQVEQIEQIFDMIAG